MDTKDKNIKKYKFKEGLSHEFEILDIAKVYSQNKDVMTVPHRAQFYQILWTEKGEGTHIVDFNPINFSKNTLIFIAQNSVNLFDENGVYEGRAILFTDDFFAKNDDDLKFLRNSNLFNNLYSIVKLQIESGSSELINILNYMEDEFKRKKDGKQYSILHNLLHVFLLKAEREMQKQGLITKKTSPALNLVLDYKELIEENFCSEKNVKNYSEKLCISEKQLSKFTKEILDKTPKQMIDERIILEAKRLLIHSSQNVKEISYGLGYDEPTNFNKFFKKHSGLTPSEFKKNFLNNN